MKSLRHVAALRPGVDPFEERQRREKTLITHVLGHEFRFVANDARLLKLAAHAYKGLPKQIGSTRAERFNIDLRLGRERDSQSKRLPGRKRPIEPGPMHLHSGAGMFSAIIDANNFAVVAPEQRKGWVAVSPKMLEFPYHVRYELIEFATYMLAARLGRLTPLHAACIGKEGRGVLIVGASGAGKSTLALHCMQEGLEFLAEDSVLIEPRELLAYGVPNFLHLRTGADHFLTTRPAWIYGAPTIRRRSGVRKFEIDVRRTRHHLAKRALQIVAVIFLVPRTPPKRARAAMEFLAPLETPELLRRLTSTQAYAASQSRWNEFVKNISRRTAYVLYRAEHPAEQVKAIKLLLG